MARLIVLFLTLIILKGAVAQDTKIDSLLKKLSGTHSHNSRVDLLNELAFAQYDYDLLKGLDFATQSYHLALKAQYPKGLAMALSLRGYYYYQSGDYRKARGLFQESSAVQGQPYEIQGYNFVLTGNLLRARAEYDSATFFYNESIRLLKGGSSPLYLAFAYRSLGKLLSLQWKNDEAEDYFRMAMGIYESKGNDFGRATICIALSELNKNRAQFKRAEEYMSMACDIAYKLKDNFLELNCVLLKGEIQYRLGDYLPALETLLRAVELLNKKDYPAMLARVYGDLGDVYDVLGQNDVALRYQFEALKITEKLGMLYETATHQVNIAWVYKNQHNFKLAFEFVEKSIDIRTSIGDESGVAGALNTKGIIYYEQQKYSEAEEWLNKSLTLRNRMNHPEGASVCLYNLALVFEAQKLYRKALSYQLSNFRIEKTIGNKYNLAGAYNSLGSLYTHLSLYDSARYFLNEGQKIGKETGSLRLRMDNAFFWSEYFEARGNTRDALTWHKEYAILNDSIYDETSANRLAEMHALYQADQKDQEIKILQQERLLQRNELQLQKTRINQQNLILISVIVGFILVSILAFKTYQYNRQARKTHQEIKQQKEELESQSRELQEAYYIIEYINKKLEAKVEDKSSALEKAYKELDTFFYRASHDFRRPLTTFLGLAEVANISVKDPNALELFSKVRETARNLDKMLLKLQSISDMGSQQMAYSEVRVAGIFNDLLEAYREDLESKHISTYTSIVLPVSFFSYPTLVHIVVDNLFENAINFSRYEGGIIRLRAFMDHGMVVIEVEDNGEGIGPDIAERIFEMYFRGSERSKGNGLGLYIVQKAMDKLNSSITFSSQFGKGSTFRVEFPPGHSPG